MVDRPAPSLTFEMLCNLGNYPVPSHLKTPIEVFIVDEQTAIPYTVLTSEFDPYKSKT